MIPLFLRLNIIPVGKSIKPLIIVIICKIQIKLGRIELLRDLLIDQFADFFIQHNMHFLPNISYSISHHLAAINFVRSLPAVAFIV